VNPRLRVAATVSRSFADESADGLTQMALQCQRAACGRLFVARRSGGKPQKFCSAKCRELAKARRMSCSHCGGSLKRRYRPLLAYWWSVPPIGGKNDVEE
jgi:hypothetical protein